MLRSVPTSYALSFCMLLSAAAACTPTERRASQLQAAEPTDAGVAGQVSRPKNRLAKETSPYLLLHAHNPVDWYPWGEEAFARARKENKLVFLSIGYASCYWCHVMERQSFMDAGIAELLNKHFVCIKVDREERPDVDDIYMTSLQLFFQAIQSPQGGGWPLSMFLTPHAKPFMGGTYFPPRAKEGQPGFDDVLRHAQQLWERQPDDVHRFAEQLADSVKEALHQRFAEGPPKLEASLLKNIQQGLVEQYDAKHGGFGFSDADPQRPKFPEPSNLAFLLARAQAKDDQAVNMLVTTLEKMARGGIFDHLGGGFHRYSTDRYWRVPHFEKMLYDNAQLVTLYAEAHALAPRGDFRRVIEGTIGFILREMTSPEGAFYAALDAETDAEEGKYYVWSTAELQNALAGDEFRLFADVYGVARGANFEGRHVLLLDQPWEAIAQDRSVTEAQLHESLDPVREKLLARRSQRPRPLTDTKVLAAWNGLMIRGLADAGRILQREEYVRHAARAAEFVLSKLRTPDGRLLRTYGADQARFNAYVEDYAFLVDGLIALHRATGDARWLEQAEHLTEKQIELFWDSEDGGFYFTSHDHESLIARGKQPIDSALPSGNAVAALNLVYLAHTLQRPDYLERAEKTIQLAAPYFQRAPTAAPLMGVALIESLKARGDEGVE